jgi:hypothetical protein
MLANSLGFSQTEYERVFRNPLTFMRTIFLCGDAEDESGRQIAKHSSLSLLAKCARRFPGTADA